MRSTVLILTSMAAVTLSLPARGEEPAALAGLNWKMGAASPFARCESPTIVVNSKLYLFGGFTSDLAASHELDVYDPAADTWTRLKPMPTEVTHLNPVRDGNTIWLAGGFKGKHPGPVTDEVWKYDIAADSWTAGPPLPEKRGGGGLAVLGRTLHFFGGYKPDRNSDSADHWTLSLDGGTSWERAADLPDVRGHVAAEVLDGKVYALGGAYGHDVKQVDVKSCEAYDPATKKWTAIASLPEGRSHFESSTIVRDGKILIVGGRCNSIAPPKDVKNDLLEYDPKTNAWTTVASMPQSLMAPSAAIVGDRIVVTSGGLNNPRPLEAATRVAGWPTGK